MKVYEVAMRHLLAAIAGVLKDSPYLQNSAAWDDPRAPYVHQQGSSKIDHLAKQEAQRILEIVREQDEY